MSVRPFGAPDKGKDNEDEDATKNRNGMICSVQDYKDMAKAKLSTAVYEYVTSGTDDEQTLQENTSAFKAWYLRPRVMRSVSRLSTATTISFGGDNGSTANGRAKKPLACDEAQSATFH